MAQSHLNVGVLSDCEKPYVIESILGGGSCGTVAKAYDRRTKRPVAIKRVELTDDPMHTLALARELRFLHALRCDNIVSLLDVNITERSLYIITELCETDLDQLIYSDEGYSRLQKSPSIVLSIMYQVLHVLAFIHSEGVLHRDIKPANILLDSNLNVKLCDFGLARMVDKDSCQAVIEPGQQSLTSCVVTLPYRAPCVALSHGRYGKAQDIWATGCTFAEMITRCLLFPGDTDVKLLQSIVDVLGKPSDEDLDFEMSERGRRFIISLDSKEIGLESSLLPGVNEVHPDLLGLLKNMLRFNPHHRITSTQACQLPLFSHFHVFPPVASTSISPSSLLMLSEDMHRIDLYQSEVQHATYYLLIMEVKIIQKKLLKEEKIIKNTIFNISTSIPKIHSNRDINYISNQKLLDCKDQEHENDLELVSGVASIGSINSGINRRWKRTNKKRVRRTQSFVHTTAPDSGPVIIFPECKSSNKYDVSLAGSVCTTTTEDIIDLSTKVKVRLSNSNVLQVGAKLERIGRIDEEEEEVDCSNDIKVMSTEKEEENNNDNDDADNDDGVSRTYTSGIEFKPSPIRSIFTNEDNPYKRRI
eukprot:gene3843-7659_t